MNNRVNERGSKIFLLYCAANYWIKNKNTRLKVKRMYITFTYNLLNGTTKRFHCLAAFCVVDWGICWASESIGGQWSDLSKRRQWLHGFKPSRSRTHHQGLYCCCCFWI